MVIFNDQNVNKKSTLLMENNKEKTDKHIGHQNLEIINTKGNDAWRIPLIIYFSIYSFYFQALKRNHLKYNILAFEFIKIIN